jgi:MoxR-like ATPase
MTVAAPIAPILDRVPEPGRCEHQPALDGLRESLGRALKGKAEVVEMVLAALLARGHILIEDLPGLGKTTLAKAVAHSVGGTFARVQCTPDLLPGDVTGFSVFDERTREFEFQPGPVFADVLLADEINRATPRTQSALFEAMAERQVTVDNRCRRLPEAFFVIATQNPVEQQGTYPLPEAQLDRFAVKLSIGYPDKSSELAMLAADVGSRPGFAEPAPPILNPVGLAALQRHVATVMVRPGVANYLVELARKTREHPDVTLGVSPRGMLTWQRMSQAWAHLHRRDFVTPDDVIAVGPSVLGVRLLGDFSDAAALIQELLETTPVPRGGD